MASVAQIGNQLRVLLVEAGSAAAVDEALACAGVQAAVEPVRANLEDVFVAATQRQHRRDEAARA